MEACPPLPLLGSALEVVRYLTLYSSPSFGLGKKKKEYIKRGEASSLSWAIEEAIFLVLDFGLTFWALYEGIFFFSISSTFFPCIRVLDLKELVPSTTGLSSTDLVSTKQLYFSFIFVIILSWYSRQILHNLSRSMYSDRSSSYLLFSSMFWHFIYYRDSYCPTQNAFGIGIIKLV